MDKRRFFPPGRGRKSVSRNLTPRKYDPPKYKRYFPKYISRLDGNIHLIPYATRIYRIDIKYLTFRKRINAVLRRVFGQRAMLMMTLRGGRRFPHAAHQRQGAPDPSSSTAASSSSSSSGGARRHSAALKHPVQPCRHVRLGHALIPRGQQSALRPFPPPPPPPPVHLARAIRGYRSVPADLSSYLDLAQRLVYRIYKLSTKGGTGFSSSKWARISSLSLARRFKALSR